MVLCWFYTEVFCYSVPPPLLNRTFFSLLCDVSAGLDLGCWFSARTVQRSTVSFSRPRPWGHMASVCLSLRDDSCGHSTSVLSRISTASLPCLEMKKNVARTYLMLLIEMSSYISHPLVSDA